MNSARRPAEAKTAPSPARPSTAGGRSGLGAGQQQDQSGPAWVPPGVRPHSPPRSIMQPQIGTRRNKAVEHTHVFLDNPDLSPDDPNNFAWLYGAFDYKLQCPPAQARATVFKMIDRLVERMERMNPPPPPPTLETFQERFGGGSGASAYGGNANLASAASGEYGGGAGNAKYGAAAATGGGGGGKTPRPPHRIKGSLIFDIISTKKHIGKVPIDGLPFRLGREIYRYVDTHHGTKIATTFVGLTDNTARRAGRDIYHRRSEDLSKNKFDWKGIDRDHMFIIFPDEERAIQEEEERNNATRGGGGEEGMHSLPSMYGAGGGGGGRSPPNTSLSFRGRGTAGLRGGTSPDPHQTPGNARRRSPSPGNKTGGTTTTSSLPSAIRGASQRPSSHYSNRNRNRASPGGGR